MLGDVPRALVFAGDGDWRGCGRAHCAANPPLGGHTEPRAAEDGGEASQGTGDQR